MFIVTANIDGETWSYGPIENECDAEELASALEQKYPSTDYTVGQLFSANDEELLRELLTA